MPTWRLEIRWLYKTRTHKHQKYLKKRLLTWIAHLSRVLNSVSFCVCYLYYFLTHYKPISIVRISQILNILSTPTMAKNVSIFGLLFSLLALVPSQIFAEESSTDAKEFVLTLDNTNFHDTVKKHDFIVVEFYAPWYVSILLFFMLFFVFVNVRFINCCSDLFYLLLLCFRS